VTAEIVDAVVPSDVDLIAHGAGIDAVSLADRDIALEDQQPFGRGAHAPRHVDQLGSQLDVGVSCACARDGCGELVDAFALDSHRLDDGHAEQVLQQIAIDAHAPLSRLVGHVQRDDHALAHVDQLQREEQVALEVHRIDHVDDDVARQDDVAGDRLLVVERADSVDARGVDHIVLADAAAREFDGRAGEVADVHVGAGQRVEHNGLTHIGVARQDNGLASGPGLGAAGPTVAQVCAHESNSFVCGWPSRPANRDHTGSRELAGVSCSACGR
jgi:hypothetical protein